jgi:hypothetical protein
MTRLGGSGAFLFNSRKNCRDYARKTVAIISFGSRNHLPGFAKKAAFFCLFLRYLAFTERAEKLAAKPLFKRIY